MNIKCEVIRDLLPLYVDGVVSEESAKLIEEHLKECAECREYCRLLKENIPEIPEEDFGDETSSLKKIKRRIFLNKLMLVMLVVGLGIAVAALFHSMNLTEYEGSLKENLSYSLLTGYEEYDEDTESSFYSRDNYINYVRETADTRETLKIYYEGMDTNEENWFSEDKTITIDDHTKVLVCRFDSDNGYDNQLDFLVVHDQEAYTLTYKCRELDKEGYYSSCSEAQEDEIVEFIRTFDYHRPSGDDQNVFARLHHNLGTAGLLLLAFTVLIFIGFPIAFAIAGMTGSENESDRVISSKDLHESMNRERAAKGESSIPSINNVQGTSSNNLARMDHSWSSVPDFFIKMIRRK